MDRHVLKYLHLPRRRNRNKTENRTNLMLAVVKLKPFDPIFTSSSWCFTLCGGENVLTALRRTIVISNKTSVFYKRNTLVLLRRTAEFFHGVFIDPVSHIVYIFFLFIFDVR